MDQDNIVLYENLKDGCYIINDEVEWLEENYKYAGAMFNRLYVQKVRLPEGRSNIIYLLSNSFENTLNMITNKNFNYPTTYRVVYYPSYGTGEFMKRRYRITGVNKNERNAMINNIKLKPYPGVKLVKNLENVFFSAGDLYRIFNEIASKLNVKRLYEEYIPEFVRILKSMTPEPMDKSKNINCNNRIMIIDASGFAFHMQDKLDEVKCNPLYLIYLAFLRNKDLSAYKVDLDMMICSKNLFIKFNPSKITMRDWSNFRLALFKIMNANLDEYTDNLSKEEKDELENTSKHQIVSSIVKNVISPFTKNISAATASVLQDAVEKKVRSEVANVVIKDKEIKKALNVDTKKVDKNDKFSSNTQSSLIHHNPVKKPLNPRQEALFKAIAGQYDAFVKPAGYSINDSEDDEYEKENEKLIKQYQDAIKNDAKEVLATDEDVKEEVLNEIQNNTVTLKKKNSAVNSKRDAKLRENQKQVVVKTNTIEKILEREASSVPIEEMDVSKVMHTSNTNMHKIKFANFDKTYIDDLMMRDIVACFDCLKDKDSPFYITDIDIKDTSTIMDYKDTWKVKLKDETGKNHTVKVDIPKFRNDRFMLLNGNQFVILKQNFYNPLVKDTPNTVMLTTNYNKITISRKQRKSLSIIEQIFSLMKKVENNKMFVAGDNSKDNIRYTSTLEYDELSRRIFKFETDKCLLVFSRKYIEEHMSDLVKKVTDLKNNEFVIGIMGNTPVVMNEDTGLDRKGHTIADIIKFYLPNEYKNLLDKIKAPSLSMYAECSMLNQDMPIIAVLVVWIGLTKALDKLGVQWKFNHNIKRLPQSTGTTKYIRFADGILEYESKTYAELIMNGLQVMHPEHYQFAQFNTDAAYADYLYSKFGNYTGIDQLKVFYEFLIDPITKDVCKDMMLPDDAPSLLIHAVKLLADNSCVSKASDKSYRTRSIEIVASILYSCIAKQYRDYVKNGRTLPMTLNQRCVIQQLMAEKTVETYSTLNPVEEMSKITTISAKGFRGSNSDYSYDLAKRSYEPDSIGKLAMSTSPNKDVGVAHVLALEPTISNARGYRDPVDPDEYENLKDVNVMAGVELLTPATTRGDDPIRTSIAMKQSSHTVPVKNSAPSLVSNGFDEAVQFQLSDDFVINAEEDGEVIDVNEDTGFIIVQYKSGKLKAINTKPEIVKNSANAFYLSNSLVPVYNKKGDKFKRFEPLAYHPKYFKYSKLNGLRYSFGPLAKVALMSTYNTYEDAGICTEKLARKLTTTIVYQEMGKFKKNNNVLYIAKVGDHVNIGDPLIKYDVSVEDNELAKYLTKLSSENASIIAEEAKNEIKTMHAGKIIAIKVYSLLQPEDLSPSLGKIVKHYFDQNTTRKKFLEKYDKSEGIVKAGYMFLDSTGIVKNKYNQIKGVKGADVIIEFYIEHDDKIKPGDKVALFGPNKQIISEVIPEGYEPYSGFRPDEEVSILTSPGTIARRMTISIVPIIATMKCMVELKRKIKKEIKF